MDFYDSLINYFHPASLPHASRRHATSSFRVLRLFNIINQTLFAFPFPLLTAPFEMSTRGKSAPSIARGTRKNIISCEAHVLLVICLQLVFYSSLPAQVFFPVLTTFVVAPGHRSASFSSWMFVVGWRRQDFCRKSERWKDATALSCLTFKGL